jgi:hypothetical protein
VLHRSMSYFARASERFAPNAPFRPSADRSRVKSKRAAARHVVGLRRRGDSRRPPL